MERKELLLDFFEKTFPGLNVLFFKNLKIAYDDYTQKKNAVHKWRRRFKKGREEIINNS